jgi:hypothetical protein
MEKNKKNLDKKEYEFSESYYKRKKALLKRMFGDKTCRKKEISHSQKKDDIL